MGKTENDKSTKNGAVPIVSDVVISSHTPPPSLVLNANAPVCDQQGSGEREAVSKGPTGGWLGPGCYSVELTQMGILKKKIHSLNFDQNSGYLSACSAMHFQEITMRS